MTVRRDAAIRLALALVLVGALVGLAAHYDVHRRSNTAVLTSVDAVVGPDPPGPGDEAYLWLTVASVDGDRVTARTPKSGSPLVVDATDLDPRLVETVDPGDVIQAYGVVAAGERELAATRLVVHERGNRRRMYVVSALGGLLAAGAFLRRWRPDAGALAFVPRAERPSGTDGSDSKEDERSG